MVFLGLNLLKTVVQRDTAIEREIARLEKQAANNALKEGAQLLDGVGARRAG